MDISAIGSQLHTARILGKKMNIFQGQDVTMLTERELKAFLENDQTGDSRVNIIFRFLANPVKAQGDQNGTLKSMTCERIQLSGGPYKQRGTLDDSKPPLELAADLTITCIGYYGDSLAGMETPSAQTQMNLASAQPVFDSETGMVQNLHGCCFADLPFSAEGTDARTRRTLVPGNYCSGWIKSGAKGVIDSTLKGAEETYNNMKNHILAEKLAKKPDPLQYLRRKQADLDHPVLDFQDWRRLDNLEVAEGKQKGKVRHKRDTNASILEGAGKTTV